MNNKKVIICVILVILVIVAIGFGIFKATHNENYLEFIAEKKLRDELNLKDGDIVSLEF